MVLSVSGFLNYTTLMHWIMEQLSLSIHHMKCLIWKAASSACVIGSLISEQKPLLKLIWNVVQPRNETHRLAIYSLIQWANMKTFSQKESHSWKYKYSSVKQLVWKWKSNRFQNTSLMVFMPHNNGCKGTKLFNISLRVEMEEVSSC